MPEILPRRRINAFLLLLAISPASALAQRRPMPLMPDRSTPHPLPAAAAAAGVVPPTNLPMLPMQEGGGRQTRRGLVIGAIIGGLGGLGIGTFLGLYCAAEGDGCWGAVPVIMVLGAAGGGLVGAIVGAAVPRGAELPPEPKTAQRDTARAPQPEAPPDAAAAEEHRIGSFGASFGWANATMERGAGPGFSGSGSAFRVSGYAEIRPWIATGLEAGHASFGEGGAVRHAALAVRASLARSVITPFLSANLGAYQSTEPSLEYLGGGIGGGVRITPLKGRRFFVDAEGRWSRNAQNIEPTRMTTLSLGAGFYW